MPTSRSGNSSNIFSLYPSKSATGLSTKDKLQTVSSCYSSISAIKIGSYDCLKLREILYAITFELNGVECLLILEQML